MHCCNTFKRQEVIHHAEETFFHLATVPGIQDDLFFSRDVKDSCSFGIKTEFFPVGDFSFGRVKYNKIRLLIKFFLIFRTNEHIGNEMRLPSNFHDETNFHAGIFMSSAETIDYEETLIGKFFNRKFFKSLPRFDGAFFIVIGIFGSCPPNFTGCAFFSCFIVNNELILRRTTGVNACHNVDCAKFGFLSNVKTFKTGFSFFVEKYFVSRVVKDFGSAGNAILR